MIFQLLHLIFGYVSIRAEGGFIERFINLCTAQGIPLWDIKKHGEYITAKTNLQGYLKIRTPAVQSGMKLSVGRKKGLPFVIRKYKNRIGLGIGILIFSFGLTFFSGRAWIIDVNGNSTVSSVEIRDAFSQAGLTQGCKFSKLNSNEIRINALSKLPDISWATINVRGCKAVIEVREVVSKPKIEVREGTSNIVALKDGQIEIVEPYKGIAKVKPGQTVLNGNLLISGIRENRIQENLFDDSDGYVVARTTNVIESTTKYKQCYQKINQKNFYSLYFSGLTYPFIPDKKAVIIYTDFNTAVINDVRLPFGYKKITYTNFGQKITAGREFTLLTAMEDFALKEYNQTLHTQIISKNIELIEDDNSITIKGTYSCFENICRRVEFSVEETASDEQ